MKNFFLKYFSSSLKQVLIFVVCASIKFKEGNSKKNSENSKKIKKVLRERKEKVSSKNQQEHFQLTTLYTI